MHNPGLKPWAILYSRFAAKVGALLHPSRPFLNVFICVNLRLFYRGEFRGCGSTVLLFVFIRAPARLFF